MPAKAKGGPPGYGIQIQTVVGRATPQTIIINTGCPNTADAGEILRKIRTVNQALLAVVNDLNDYELARQAAEQAELQAQQASEHAASPTCTVADCSIDHTAERANGDGAAAS